jgi:hypothetical protein
MLSSYILVTLGTLYAYFLPYSFWCVYVELEGCQILLRSSQSPMINLFCVEIPRARVLRLGKRERRERERERER